MAQNDFYRCDPTDKEALEKVNKRIQEMLPQLLTLNNRILSLGVEKREQRKKHYEEKQGEKKEKRVQKEIPVKKERAQKVPSAKVSNKGDAGKTTTSVSEPTHKDVSVDTKEPSATPLMHPTDTITPENASTTDDSTNPKQVWIYYFSLLLEPIWCCKC